MGKENCKIPRVASKKVVELRPGQPAKKDLEMVLYPGRGNGPVSRKRKWSYIQKETSKPRSSRERLKEDGCLDPGFQMDQVKTGAHNGAMR